MIQLTLVLSIVQPKDSGQCVLAITTILKECCKKSLCVLWDASQQYNLADQSTLVVSVVQPKTQASVWWTRFSA